MEKSYSKNKKQWMAVYFGGENGAEYLTENERQTLLSAVNIKEENSIVQLKDGRVLSTSFQRIVPNPNYIDPIEDEKKAHYYFLWNCYQSLKKAGTFDERYGKDPTFKFKTWYKENKQKLDKEYEETKKCNT